MSHTTAAFGSLTAVVFAVVTVVAWSLGLIFDQREERVLTSLATVITFAMVFIIQSAQNRQSRAIQTKLDALLIAEERLDEQALLGLEQRPDSTIKGVQSEVHASPGSDEA